MTIIENDAQELKNLFASPFTTNMPNLTITEQPNKF